MRLKSVRLAGFKSFVDPTTVALRSNLVGIVGPNGCGKSNVVDAVRWVLGESSAKQLRSDEMADVIFNGSGARKPIGQASVELLFDNSDGALGGQYANYAEISVKRQVSRDGQSHYYLNATRCRRRDITDLFLGTGLGPRSYAIIEQGMVSRLIEAKPEELRNLLEEAAGISRYRERRRETENRIRHTRENMDRISDLREELGRQLTTLERQAQAAERYKEFKAEERQLRSRLFAARLQQLERQRDGQQRDLADLETRREEAVAQLRGVESALESLRARQQDQQEAMAKVQEAFYAVGADIARAEQRLEHDRGLLSGQRERVQRLRTERAELARQLADDDRRGEALARELADLEPRTEAARREQHAAEDALAAAEAELAQANRQLQEANGAESQVRGELSAAEARLEHLQGAVEREQERLARLDSECAGLAPVSQSDPVAERQEQLDHSRVQADRLAQALADLDRQLEQSAAQLADGARALDRVRTRRQELAGRMASLQASPETAVGAGARLQQLIAEQDWGGLPQLVAALRVEAPWETAVEAVLGARLRALMVDDLDATLAALGDRDLPELVLARPAATGEVPDAKAPEGLALLQSTVSGVRLPASWLAGVYCAPDAVTAMRRRGDLGPAEVLVTPDGRQWGQDWLQTPAAEQGGVLAREREIAGLAQQLADVDREESDQVMRLEALTQQRQRLSAERAEAARELAATREQLTAHSAALAAAQSEARLRRERLQEVEDEIHLLRQRLEADRGSLEATGAAAAVARTALQARQSEREDAVANQQRCEQARTEAVAAVAQARASVNEIALARQGRDSELHGLRESTARWREQLAKLEVEMESTERTIAGKEQPLRELESALQALLAERSRIDGELGGARDALAAVESDLRREQERRRGAEQRVQDAAEARQQAQLRMQEIQTMVAGLLEQAAEHSLDQPDLEALADEALDGTTIRESLEQVERRITRLGAINLAAIDERAQVAERKTYLDRQHDDLTEALATMESTIRKIDRETRSRFKETFDKVQAGLQAGFPRLFGGGHASLALTGDDLLTAGVAVEARPPGKRNSSIHQLSGGEKSLTAIALIFSIFELNPAPFCILDEVDAPLDDANVARYCDLVREMSSRVQFVFITHNKTTMALSQQLTGVTMSEPGVSRLVAVDLDDAVELASA